MTRTCPVFTIQSEISQLNQRHYDSLRDAVKAAEEVHGSVIPYMEGAEGRPDGEMLDTWITVPVGEHGEDIFRFSLYPKGVAK